MTDLTVCICTYNRAELLRTALTGLSEAHAPVAGSWELLLVDNNSGDQTAEVAENFASKMPLRYVREARQGLSWSRNRALRECKGDLLVFMDDDVRVDHGWMHAYLQAAGWFPEAGFFGGRLFPDWSRGRPKWLLDEDLAHLSGLIGKYDLGDRTRPLELTDPLPFGANFGVRRSLFDQIAPFRTDLGVVGRTPGRGEEAEYLVRACSAGATGAYVAEATSYHLVDPSHLKLGHLYRFGVEKGVAAARMADERADESGYRVRAGLALLKGLLQLTKGRGDRFRQCVINMGIEVGLERERREGGTS